MEEKLDTSPVRRLGKRFNRKTNKNYKEMNLKELNRYVQRLNRIVMISASMPELKYTQLTLNQSSITSSWTAACLNGLVRGTQRTTRVGDLVRFRKLEMNISVTPNSSLGYGTLRIILVWYKLPEGQVIIPSDVASAGISTLYVVAHQKEFEVIFDKTYSVNFSGVQTIVDRFTGVMNKLSDYSIGNAGDATDFTKNSLWGMWTGNDSSDNPVLSGEIRLWFNDE